MTQRWVGRDRIFLCRRLGQTEDRAQQPGYPGDVGLMVTRAQGYLTQPVAALASACITVLLLGLRAPDVFTHPQMWAEDATIYWLQQYQIGSIAILQSYANYWQLLPRLVAWFASFFNYEWAPNIFAVWSVIVTAWTAATISVTSPSPQLGLVLGVTLLLPPHADGEVFGNITNLQWLTAPALAVIAGTSPPSRRFYQINQLVFTVLAALTGPLTIFLVPMLTWRFWRYRDMVSSVALLCSAVQIAVIVSTGGGPIPGDMYHPIALARQFILRTVPSRTAQVITVLLLATCLIPGRERALRISFVLLGAAVSATTLLKFINNSDLFDYGLNGPVITTFRN